jgi:hypothetical protein
MKPISELKEQETWSSTEASVVLGIPRRSIAQAMDDGEIPVFHPPTTSDGRPSAYPRAWAKEVRAWAHDLK